MRLLDLFCGAGGAGMGYHQAGFEVVGVDINPQPRYPFEFHQADALEYVAEHGREFDVIHASPPCQRYSTMTKRWNRQDKHPDLIPKTRELLIRSNKDFIIENVPGAPLIDPIMLCGTMFGLQNKQTAELRRHRLFELSFMVLTPECQHSGRNNCGFTSDGKKIPVTVGVYGHAGGSSKRDGLYFFNTQDWKDAMGIDWMTGTELSEAIPPAYTKFIGEHLMKVIGT